MGFHPGGFPALSGMSVTAMLVTPQCLEEPGKVRDQLKFQL